VTDQAGETTIGDVGGGGASIVPGSGRNPLRMVTVDQLVQENNISLGFMKADVEGYGLKVIKGALKTIKEQRPIVSISSYHSFEELYGISTTLRRELTDYYFEWHMENMIDWALFEISFFAIPEEEASA